ncbi:hypothetical protein [Serratia liquefaciens]|uniref:hypothetical protein n=1 Tax=Serratia liquefaciens TaxID=614 RepID=UPI003906BD46
MTNNTKELVAAGHALVKEMATLATDHKCFNSAELVRELATQLDVQRARADLLAADNEKALSVLKEANESVLRAKGTIDGLVVENAYLLPKAASELSNAWMLHKYWVGINAALMHIWAGRLPDAVAWLENTVSGPGIDAPEFTNSKEIEEWAADQQKNSISHAKALEIIKEKAPATNVALAVVRAQACADLIAVFDQHIQAAGLDDGELVTVLECRDALKHAADLSDSK